MAAGSPNDRADARKSMPGMPSLTCVQCNKVTNEIWKKLACNHEVCIQCIRNNLEVVDAAFSCFGCNGGALDTGVRCIGFVFGCDFQFNSTDRVLPQLTSHFEACFLRPEWCPGECNLLISRQYLSRHLQEWCVKRILSCTQCKAFIPSDAMEKHMTECDMTPLNCQYCKKTGLNRSNMKAHLNVCSMASKPCQLSFLGCTFQGTEMELKRHDSVQLHMRYIADFCRETKATIGSLSQQVDNFNSVKHESNERMLSLNESLRKNKQEHEYYKRESGEAIEKLKLHVQGLQQNFGAGPSSLHSQVDFLKYTSEKLGKQTKQIGEEVKQLRGEILTTVYDEFEEIKEERTKVGKIESLLQNSYNSPDGNFVENFFLFPSHPFRWEISSYENLKEAGKLVKNFTIFSNPFRVTDSDSVFRLAARVNHRDALLCLFLEMLHSGTFEKKNSHFLLKLRDVRGGSNDVVRYASADEILHPRYAFAYPRSPVVGIATMFIEVSEYELQKHYLKDDALEVVVERLDYKQIKNLEYVML